LIYDLDVCERKEGDTMRDPDVIEVRPVGEMKGYTRKIMISGAITFGIGVFLLFVPVSLNIVIATLVLLLGIVMLTLLWRTTTSLWGTAPAWGIIVFGILAMAVPTIFNFLLIGLVVLVAVLVAQWFLAMGQRLAGWLLIVLSIVGGLIMWAYPLALNQIFAVYLILAGASQMIWGYKLSRN
jgi:uncharacterized membrane protein HdeD (DUF308 family)